MLSAAHLEVLRGEAQAFLDGVAAIQQLQNEFHELVDRRPTWPWPVLARHMALGIQPRRGEVPTRRPQDCDLESVTAYEDRLVELTERALLGVSWGRRALHEAGANFFELGRLALTVPPAHAVWLPEGLPEVGRGFVDRRALEDLQRVVERALGEASYNAVWSQEREVWSAWAKDEGRSPAEIDDLRTAVDLIIKDRFGPPSTPGSEHLRGSRETTWGGALRAVQGRFADDRVAQSPAQRKQVEEARSYLAAATRGGRGAKTSSEKRRELPPADPYESDELIQLLKRFVTVVDPVVRRTASRFFEESQVRTRYRGRLLPEETGT